MWEIYINDGKPLIFVEIFFYKNILLIIFLKLKFVSLTGAVAF